MCESTCDTLSSSVANQGDNIVLVAQGSTATPGATQQLLPHYIYIIRTFNLCLLCLAKYLSLTLSPSLPLSLSAALLHSLSLSLSLSLNFPIKHFFFFFLITLFSPSPFSLLTSLSIYLSLPICSTLCLLLSDSICLSISLSVCFSLSHLLVFFCLFQSFTHSFSFHPLMLPLYLSISVDLPGSISVTVSVSVSVFREVPVTLWLKWSTVISLVKF